MELSLSSVAPLTVIFAIYYISYKLIETPILSLFKNKNPTLRIGFLSKYSKNYEVTFWLTKVLTQPTIVDAANIIIAPIR
mgnify:CR=1 FL=1